jgi:hypothetical protein
MSCLHSLLNSSSAIANRMFYKQICKQKSRHLIGQTAITWPLHAVSENRGKDHFTVTLKFVLGVKKHKRKFFFIGKLCPPSPTSHFALYFTLWELQLPPTWIFVGSQNVFCSHQFFIYSKWFIAQIASDMQRDSLGISKSNYSSSLLFTQRECNKILYSKLSQYLITALENFHGGMAVLFLSILQTWNIHKNEKCISNHSNWITV